MKKELIRKICETLIGIILIFVGIGLCCGIIEMIFDVLHTISHYISDIGLLCAIIVTGVFVLRKIFNIDIVEKIKKSFS